MQINISARHGHLSAGTQQRITDKVVRLRRFFDRITGMQVTVDLENRETPLVELRVSAELTDDFVASDQGELIGAVESVAQKMEQQLRKHKEKITGHRGPGLKGAAIQEVATPLESEPSG